MTTTKSRKEYSSFLSDCLATLCVLAALYLGAERVKKLYYERTPPHVDGPQEHYRDITHIPSLENHSPLFWVELGKNDRLVTGLIFEPNFSVELPGFSVGLAWRRPVSWHVYTNGQGVVKVSFPPGVATHLALFATDGDSFWRMWKLMHSGETIVVDGLHDGRWIVVPLTAEERVRGSAELELSKLTGANIALSAIALFRVS